MKAHPIISTSVSLLMCASLYAQNPTPAPAAKPPVKDIAAPELKLDDPKKPAAEAPVPEAKPEPEAPAPRELPGLDKLSPEKKKILLTGMGEVSTYLRGVRWQEALEKLSDMEAACGENHYIENLRGAVFTRMRNFDQAREHFKKALELAKSMDSEAFHPRFNLAELDFVTKKWDQAREAFLKLLKDPGKPNAGSDALINFKILICDLQQKKVADADAILSTFDQYDDQSPAYYYGQAAKLFSKDDKEGAQEWLESAKRIYPKDTNEVYNDSFVEMGWLETLQ